MSTASASAWREKVLELNLTLDHLAALVAMAWFASTIYKGAKLYRCVAWLALWQLLTPVRSPLDDLLLLLFGWFMCEWMFVRWRAYFMMTGRIGR